MRERKKEREKRRKERERGDKNFHFQMLKITITMNTCEFSSPLITNIDILFYSFINYQDDEGQSYVKVKFAMILKLVYK